MAAADAADGTIDGRIDLDLVAGVGGSYQFVGAAAGDQSGWSVASAGDVDGDGRDDLAIGAPYADGGGADSGESYLIMAADLGTADAADGTLDGVIDLGLVAGLNSDNALAVTVNDTGSGTAVQSGFGTDSFTSVEHFVANEVAGEIDSITLVDTSVDDPTYDPTGARFAVSDLSGLDDTAVGTFRLDNGTVLSFGPDAALQLSGILALNRPGELAIIGGDESGSVGGISFENFEEINFGIICFAKGTRIKTITGERPVEDLAVGDLVLTMDAGYQPIRWIGGRKLDAAALAANPKLMPIRIKAGALGPDLPVHDLVVSPQHRILVRNGWALQMFDSAEVLIPANKLLTLPGIDIERDADGVEYFHFLFDAHQIVWSNGTPSESLFTGPEALKAVSPEARAEIAALFPEILAPGFVPHSARPIPAKGKQMKILAQKLAKSNQPAVALSTPL
jgi:hypothetical protein